jgi:hypothetical protein
MRQLLSIQPAEILVDPSLGGMLLSCFDEFLVAMLSL